MKFQKNRRPTKFERAVSEAPWLWRVPTLPTKRSPRGGCAYNHFCHTRTLWLSFGAPLQWFHGLPSWGGKFSLYLPLLLPQSACFLRLVILWPQNGPDWPVIILRNSCTYTRFGQKWGSGRSSRRLAWRSGYMSPTRVRTHTHTQTQILVHKKPLGHIPCFFVVTNNKYQKRKCVHVPDSSPCCKYIWTTPYD